MDSVERTQRQFSQQARAEAVVLSGHARSMGRQAALLEEDLAEAERCFADSVGLYQQLNLKTGYRAPSLNALGQIAMRRGDTGAAAARYVKALLLARDIGRRDTIGESLAGLAAIGAATGRFECATRLLAFAGALWAGLTIPPPQRSLELAATAKLRAEQNGDYSPRNGFRVNG